MRIIGFGDLYLDYYFKNGLLVGVMGGKTSANILCNLSSKYNTKYIGVVGNDTAGNLCIKTLDKLNVDTSSIKVIDEVTKKFYLSEDGYDTICPYCNRRLQYHGTKLEVSDVLNNILEDDILIIDNINETSIEVIKNTNNLAFIDIGYLGDLKYMSLDEIIDLLSNRFKIINLNERVYNYIKKKFSIDLEDLYNYLNPDILIITRGKRGSDIIYNGEFEKKEIENPVTEIDATGAGDAYFSEFISYFIENTEINARTISLAYMKASSKSAYVVTQLGARTHLMPLVKITNYKECICCDFEHNL